MIPVTKPYLPSRERIFGKLEKSYSLGHVTNFGPLQHEFECQLKDVLNVEHLLVVANATIGLQLALKVFELSGPIATTSFSFAATAQSIEWVGAKPTYVDINRSDWNISVTDLQRAEFANCNGVMATHVFGAHCDFDGLRAWAGNRPVIYDAAHAFGTTTGQETNCWQQGDASVCSLHATKIMHSIEGGFITFKESADCERARKIMNFGLSKDGIPSEMGTNAKMSDFHAAVGLCVLEDFENLQEKRSEIFEAYERKLGDYFEFQSVSNPTNKMYVPILFETEQKCVQSIEALKSLNIHPRRYFYPALSDALANDAEIPCRHASDVASRILCLPSFHELSVPEIQTITDTVLREGV